MVYTKVFQRFKGSGLKHVNYTVVSTHDRLWVTHAILSVSGLGGLRETKNVSSLSTCESQYCGEPP